MCHWFHNDNVFRQFYIFKALWGRVTFQTAIVVIKGMSFQLFTLQKHKLYTNRQIRSNFCLPLSDGIDIISPTSKHPRIRKVIKVIKYIYTYMYTITLNKYHCFWRLITPQYNVFNPLFHQCTASFSSFLCYFSASSTSW